jgi:NTP pyrophosphatase (non-canonical NTP hydrolase)
MDISALQKRLRGFAAARDWQPYHAPKNLAMALMVEAAELMELFQWSTLAESRALTRDSAQKERVADEIADVFLYLLQLADHTQVNIQEAVEAKLRKNANKHPPKHPHMEMQPVGKRVHLLVDWENVQPDGQPLKVLVPEASNVWLLHGPSQKIDTSSHVQCFGEERVVKVPRSGAGKNALDFQLCFYAGYLSSSRKGDEFVIVSNDKGYDAMVEHARLLKFAVRRVEYRKAAPVASTGTASVKKLPTVLKPLPPSAAQIAWRLITHRRNCGEPGQPWTAEDMYAIAISLIWEPIPAKAELAQRACAMAQLRIKFQGLGRIACPELGRPAVAAPSSDGIARVASAVGEVAAQKSAQEAASTQAKASVTSEKRVPALVASEAKRVAAALQKMQAHLPGTQAALLKTIQTVIGGQNEHVPELAQQVLVALVRRQDVQCLPDGKRVRFPRLEAARKKVDSTPAKSQPTQVPQKQALKKTEAKKTVAKPAVKKPPTKAAPKKTSKKVSAKKSQATSSTPPAKQSQAQD